jgi:hypothetical protein
MGGPVYYFFFPQLIFFFIPDLGGTMAPAGPPVGPSLKTINDAVDHTIELRERAKESRNKHKGLSGVTTWNAYDTLVSEKH